MNTGNDTRETAESIDTADLVAYAEGRLAAGTPLRERIEQHLREHAGDAARVQAYARQDAAIRHTWGAVAEAPLPARLQPARLAADHGAGVHRGWPAALAASIVIAASAGWLLGRADIGGPAPVEQFAQQVAGSFQTGASSLSHGDGITTVRAGEHAGMQLAGMPFVATESADGLQRFQYAGPDGDALQFFVGRHAGDSDPVRTLQGDGFNLVYWQQDATLYALGGALDLPRLEAIAYQAMADLASGTMEAGIAPETPQPAFKVEPLTPIPAPEATLGRDFPITRMVAPVEGAGSL